MENIILLILFTYPGAIADYFHSRMVQGKQYDKKPDEFFRVARDFFLSALISMLTMTIYCQIRRIAFSIEKVAEDLRSVSGMWLFLVISLAGAWLCALLWYAWDKYRLRAMNRIRRAQGEPEIGETKSVWATMMSDKSIPFNNCALAFYKDGKLLKAGLAYEVSDDYQNDPWAILTWTETAMKDLKRPEEERTLLISPDHTFINFDNGIYVDVYDGTKFRNFIYSWTAEQVSAHSAEEEREQE